MNRKSQTAITLIVLGMTGVLVAMGRRLWCQCGQAIPWSWDIWTEHSSQHLIDPYFFTHVLHGVIFFWILSAVGSFQKPPLLSPSTKWTLAILAEALWEVFENSPMVIHRYRETTMALGYTGDSIANSIFDVIACALGYYAASRIRARWSLVMLVVFEVGMLMTIRDSLLLNIIMLLSPIEAIKEWQMQAAPILSFLA